MLKKTMRAVFCTMLAVVLFFSVLVIPVYAAGTILSSHTQSVNGVVTNQISTSSTAEVQVSQRITIESSAANLQIIFKAPAALKYKSSSALSSILKDVTVLDNDAGVALSLYSTIGYNGDLTAVFSVRSEYLGQFQNGESLGQITIEHWEGGALLETLSMPALEAVTTDSPSASVSKSSPSGDISYYTPTGTLALKFNRSAHESWKLESGSQVVFTTQLPLGVYLNPSSGFALAADSGDGVTTPQKLVGTFPASDWNNKTSANADVTKSLPITVDTNIYAPAEGGRVQLNGTIPLDVSYTLVGGTTKTVSAQTPLQLYLGRPSISAGPELLQERLTSGANSNIRYAPTGAYSYPQYIFPGDVAGPQSEFLLGDEANAAANNSFYNAGTTPYYGVRLELNNCSDTMPAAFAYNAIRLKYSPNSHPSGTGAALAATYVNATSSLYLKIIVHYVDENGTELTEVFTTTPRTAPVGGTDNDYVVYSHQSGSFSTITKYGRLNLKPREYIRSIEAIPVLGGEEGVLPPCYGISIQSKLVWPTLASTGNYRCEYVYPDGSAPKEGDVWDMNAIPPHVYYNDANGNQVEFPLVTRNNTFYLTAGNSAGRVSVTSSSHAANTGSTFDVQIGFTNVTGYGANAKWENYGAILEIPSDKLEYVGAAGNVAQYPFVDGKQIIAEVVDGKTIDASLAGKTYIRLYPADPNASIPVMTGGWDRHMTVTLRVKPGVAAASYSGNNGFRVYAYTRGGQVVGSAFTKIRMEAEGSTNTLYTDTYDLDDNQDSRYLMIASAGGHSFTVNSTKGLQATTYVKGDAPGEEWIAADSDTAGAAQILPGGVGQFRLVIQNTGNFDTQNIKLLDILPYYGDMTVKDPGSARGSMWTPTFDGLSVAVKNADGTTVSAWNQSIDKLYFSSVHNPVRSMLTDAWAGGDNPDGFTLKSDWKGTDSDIVSFFYSSGSGNTLKAGQYIEITGRFLAPMGAPVGLDAINTFGYRYTYAGGAEESAVESRPGRFQVVNTGLAQVGSFVFVDGNSNGVHDLGEPGLNDVQVLLYRCDDLQGSNRRLVTSQKTVKNASGAPGYYCFSNLAPGYYQVYFGPMDGYVRTVKGTDSLGADPYSISRPDPASGFTDVFEVQPGQSRFDINAGYQSMQSANITGTVTRDGTLEGVGGIEASLLVKQNGSFVVLRTVTTDDNGYYAFYGLDSTAEYQISMRCPNITNSMTFNIDGEEPTAIYTFGVTPGQSYDLDVLVADYVTTITGKVWLDENLDGCIGLHEQEGLQVTLLVRDSDDNIVGAPIASDSHGNYAFYNLKPLAPGEKYYIQVYYPTGQYDVSEKNAGNTPNADNRAVWVPGTPPYAQITVDALADTQVLAGQNVGLTSRDRASLVVVAFYDKNGNGVMDAGEEALPGGFADIGLINGSTPIPSSPSDAAGRAEFLELPSGAYDITLTPLAGYKITGRAQVNRYGYGSSDVTVSSPSTSLNLYKNNEATLYVALQKDPGTAVIGGTVWFDDNGDGKMDGETGRADGVTVELLDAAGDPFTVPITTTTDSFGAFSFGGLNGGEYRIRVATPAGSAAPGGLQYTFTLLTGKTLANRVETADGLTAAFTLLEDQQLTGIGAGVQRKATAAYEMNGGGTPVPAAPGAVPYGQKLVKPADPERDHYTFEGWYLDDGTFQQKWDFGTAVTQNMTLYARWLPVYYTVSYDSHGGDMVNDTTQLYGSLINTEPQPTRTGYAFSGWYASGGYIGSRVTFPYTVEGNATLHAKWTGNPYRIFYNSSGGSAVAAQDIAYGENTQAPTPPTKQGFTFAGWYTDAGCTTAFTFGLPYATMGNTTLYADWSDSILAVNFDTGGGSTVPQQNITYGGYATKPSPNPTRAHSDFAGWYTDTTYATAWNFAAMAITDDTTIYAKWTPTRYTVTFATVVGTAPNTQSVPYGEYAAEPTAPTARGYVFLGWYTDNLTFLDPWDFLSDTVGGSITLYANWDTLTGYQISYAGNGSEGGSVPVDNGYYYSGESFPVAGNTGGLSRAGYSFVGWNTQPDGGGQGYAPGDAIPVSGANVQLHAVWSKDTYYVTYDANGGTAGGVPADPAGYSYNDVVGVLYANAIAHEAEPDAYRFGGWNTQPDGLGTDYPEGASFHITGSITLYAKWIPLWQVTYNGNGNTGGAAPVNSDYYEPGTSFPVAGPDALSRTGCSFGGWSTEANGPAAYSPGDMAVMPEGGITLYAVWAKLPYSLSYDGNGATGGSAPTAGQYRYGDQVQAAQNTGNLVKAGMVFAGWNTQPDGGGVGYGEGTAFVMPANDLTLYAQWREVVLRTGCDLLALRIGTVDADLYSLSASVSVPAGLADYSILTMASGGATASLWADAACTVPFGASITATSAGSVTLFYIRVQAEDPTVPAKVYEVTVTVTGSNSTSGDANSGSSPENPAPADPGGGASSSGATTGGSGPASSSTPSGTTHGADGGTNDTNGTTQSGGASQAGSGGAGNAQTGQGLVLELSTVLQVLDRNGEPTQYISGEGTAVMLFGDKIVINPNIPGGEWHWDEEWLSATFNSPATFTGLKTGQTTVSYTVNGQTASILIEILDTDTALARGFVLEDAGQGKTPCWLWLMIAFVVLLGGWLLFLFIKRRRKRGRQ